VCINSISECSAANGDTVVKGHVLNYPVNGNINRMGVKMQPCLTPEVVEILDDSFCPTVIHTLVFSCRVAIRDVKTVYFSKPVTGLPKPVFNRLPNGLL